MDEMEIERLAVALVKALDRAAVETPPFMSAWEDLGDDSIRAIVSKPFSIYGRFNMLDVAREALEQTMEDGQA